jgi:hypothetical protein
MGCDGLLGGEFSQTIDNRPGVYKEGKYNDFLPGEVNLYNCLQYIKTDEVQGPATTHYTIVLIKDEMNLAPWYLTPHMADPKDRDRVLGNFANKEITLRGGATPVILSPKRDHFDEIPLLGIGTYEKGVTGTVTGNLGKNITLQGFEDNKYPLVQVLEGGVLNILDGAKITGNTRTLPPDYSGGGGVEIIGGIVTMKGGIISGNTVTADPSTTEEAIGGGGIAVYDGGTFTMEGGEIRGNKVEYPQGIALGGGIAVIDGTFNLKGGLITENEADSKTATAMGGGIYLAESSEFTLEHGTISKNKVTGTNPAGGGVYTYEKNYTPPEGIISSDNEPDGLFPLPGENNSGGEGDKDNGDGTGDEGDGDDGTGDGGDDGIGDGGDGTGDDDTGGDDDDTGDDGDDGGTGDGDDDSTGDDGDDTGDE